LGKGRETPRGLDLARSDTQRPCRGIEPQKTSRKGIHSDRGRGRKKNNSKPVRPFVLYSLRHTFLTRLGESGCDVWTLASIAGHSQIGISSRYVHPSDNAMFAALPRLGGHKIGHNEETAIPTNQTTRQLSQ
jgi:integrase